MVRYLLLRHVVGRDLIAGLRTGPESMPRRHFCGGTVAGLSRFQFGHALGEVPQGAIEFCVLIDRLHFAGGGTVAARRSFKMIVPDFMVTFIHAAA